MPKSTTTWDLQGFLEETEEHELFRKELGMSRIGNPASKIVLVLGPNGAGKSLLRRWVTQTTKDAEILCMHLSMSGRRAYMASMVYGDESSNSTGNLSGRLVTGSIHNSRSRADIPHVVFLDEPDVGASNELCASMGRYMTTQIQAQPLPALAFFIVTHSEHLVRELLPLDPQVVFIGPAFPSLEAWMARPLVPIDLEAFGDECRARYQRVQEFLTPHKNALS